MIAALVGGQAMESPHNGLWRVYDGTYLDGKPRLWEPRDRQEEALRRGLLTDAGSTRSLDAAMLLLPEHMSCETMYSAAGPPTFTRCRLWDWRRSPKMADPDNEWKAEGNRPLPINIVIACLRARQASTGQQP